MSKRFIWALGAYYTGQALGLLTDRGAKGESQVFFVGDQIKEKRNEYLKMLELLRSNPDYWKK